MLCINRSTYTFFYPWWGPCRGIVAEVDAYDRKTKEQVEGGEAPRAKIPDFKKTSLIKPLSLFAEFLRELEREAKRVPLDF